MKKRILITEVMALIAFIGCTNSSDTLTNSNSGSTYSLMKSEKTRESASEVTTDEIKNVAGKNNQFGFELLREYLKQKPSANIVISPYSLYSAFAMTYAGARNSTEKEMERIFHFGSQSGFHRQFNALQQSIESLNSSHNKISISNSIWCQNNYHFENSFLDLMAQEYGTGIHTLDFLFAEKARKIINSFVEEKTDALIVDLLPENSINSDTRLVLLNTLYIRALWEIQFSKELTKSGSFFSGDTRIETDFMSIGSAERMKFIKNDTITAVEMRYKESELVMDLIMTANEKRITDFSSDVVANICDNMSESNVLLSIPKLSISAGTVTLKELLKSMGMIDAFCSAADFSGMTGTRGLFIGDAYHQVSLDVLETGTIAAAATAVVMTEKSMPDAESLKFDHPFILSIRDRSTGTIFFLGAIYNPEK